MTSDLLSLGFLMIGLAFYVLMALEAGPFADFSARGDTPSAGDEDDPVILALIYGVHT